MSQNNSLRKSVKKEAKKGNKTKYDLYKEAFARIKSANESNFFLEAVAIQEAIISDRLKSHLGHLGKLPKRKRPTLFDLVETWKSENQGRNLEIKINLPELVDQWRVLRNQAVHGLVCTPGVDDFLNSAKAAAITGEVLARAVCAWHKKEVRNSKNKKK
jgi:hypothetical protein